MEHLFRLAYRFCGNSADAEDLVQDLLAKIYPKRDELRNTPQLKLWLSKVLYHLFVDGMRKNALQYRLLSQSEFLADEYENEGPGPELMTQSMMQQQKIESAYLQLPHEHRVVLSMHDMEGYTLIEMVQILEVPIGTLKSRLHRARANMKKRLASIDDEMREPGRARKLPKTM